MHFHVFVKENDVTTNCSCIEETSVQSPQEWMGDRIDTVEARYAFDSGAGDNMVEAGFHNIRFDLKAWDGKSKFARDIVVPLDGTDVTVAFSIVPQV
jgi:hypothetical protein